MRDILSKLEVLTESRGLSGRVPGDLFVRDDETLTFNELQYYPEEGGRYSPEEMGQLLNSLGEVNWLNQRTSKSGGVGVASFTDAQGNEVYYGRFFQDIKPSKMENYFPNEIDGFRLKKGSSDKTRSGMTPQELLAEKSGLSIADVMNQLAGKLGTSHPLYHIAHRVAVGEEMPFTFKKPEDVSFAAFRDYFCEILQPIAFLKGTVTGNADEAIEKFFGGTVEGASISFDQSMNAGLSDSILQMSDGRQLKLSTKGGKGAYASAKNLLDSINELDASPAGPKLRKKYGEIIDLVENIKAEGQAGAPLYLAVKFGIIKESDAVIVSALKNKPVVSLKNIDKLDYLTPKLKALAKQRNTDNPNSVDLFYHLTAAIAFKAAEKVNETTNFSKAAAEILNNGALVQVYTKASESKDSWTLRGFEAVYPGESIKGVYLTASKTYYSTGIKGNFTFKIDKGEGKPSKEKNEDESGSSDVGSSFSDDDLIAGAAQITGDVSSDFTKPKTKPSVGREKRKKP